MLDKSEYPKGSLNSVEILAKKTKKMAKNLREFTPDKILIQKNKGNGKNILNNYIHKLL